MTVKELREELEHHDDDDVVMFQYWSDEGDLITDEVVFVGLDLKLWRGRILLRNVKN